MSEPETVEYLRRLRPYRIAPGEGNIDPYVDEYFKDKLDKETLAKLLEYTSGFYTEELHYRSFFNYRRTKAEDDQNGQRLRSHPSFAPALNRLLHDLSDLKTIPIPTNQLDDVPFQPASAAGYGYVGNKRDNYYLARRNASRALYDFEKYGDKYRFVPDMAFARCQLIKRADPKVRHVWGHAFHHILLEGCIAWPIIEKLLTTDSPIYVGKDLHKDLPYQIIKLMESGGTAYCLDFSRFDSTLSSEIIDVAWDVIEYLCPPTNYSDALNLKLCKTLFQNTPLLMPDGRLFKVTAGLPSGSYFTQIIGSICNLLLMYMLLHHIGHPDAKCKVLGDDSIFVLPSGTLTVDDAKNFFAQFGMIVNVDKSIVTKKYTDIYFLGHNYYGSRVTREEFTCLSMALYSECPITSPQHSIVRIASLLYDCGFNSFGLYNLYKYMLNTFEINWNLEDSRPASLYHPYYHLFVLS